MTEQNYHILLLALPGYHRNGIEAALQTLNHVAVQIASNCESAKKILASSNPKLFLIIPRGINLNMVWDTCANHFKDRNEQVVLLVEPYSDKIELSPNFTCEVFEIGTLNTLKEMVLGKIFAS